MTVFKNHAVIGNDERDQWCVVENLFAGHQGQSVKQSDGIYGHVWWGMLCGQMVVV